MSHNIIKKLLSCFIISSLTFLQIPQITYATETTLESEAQQRLEEPIESNAIKNWPIGPAVSAEGAILIEANTGTILYSKNIHEKLYPASTTKILTTLLAIENSDLNDMVEFSRDAVFSIERDSSNMGMDVGQSITMEQCLYGILVYSANEAANAVAEHIAGSIDSYVDMMNQKAAALGCTDSHFVTTNGLHDDNHYTTAFDLSQIARAFFLNETLAKISGTNHYEIQPTATQPDYMDLYTHNKLTNGTYKYEGYVGGKTGYTSQAHQTLVTCAERNGMRLICVVMKEDAPSQYIDTMALFDYGFNNFQKMNVYENEKNYTVTNSDFFESNSELFGNNETIMSINPQNYIVLPTTATFEEVDSTLSYEESDADSSCVATIDYTYNGVSVGTAKVDLAEDNEQSYDFESPVVTSQDSNSNTNDKIIFVNVVKIIAIVLSLILLLVLIIILKSFLKNYHFSRRKRNKIKFKSERNKRRSNRNRRRWKSKNHKTRIK